MDLKEKLAGAGYKPGCPCFECSNIIGAARMALEAVKENFLSPNNVCDLDDIDALLASLSDEVPDAPPK